jgi:hypothetical protein
MMRSKGNNPDKPQEISFTISNGRNMRSTFVLVSIVVILTAGLINAQTVEKYSTSFSFPLTLTSANGVTTAASPLSFFRMAGHSIQKGKITLEWNIAGSTNAGTISIFSISGALVKKMVLSTRYGTTQADLGRVAAGVYFASISFGSYRQNLKLALYR